MAPPLGTKHYELGTKRIFRDYSFQCLVASKFRSISLIRTVFLFVPLKGLPQCLVAPYAISFQEKDGSTNGMINEPDWIEPGSTG